MGRTAERITAQQSVPTHSQLQTLFWICAFDTRRIEQRCASSVHIRIKPSPQLGFITACKHINMICSSNSGFGLQRKDLITVDVWWEKPQRWVDASPNPLWDELTKQTLEEHSRRDGLYKRVWITFWLDVMCVCVCCWSTSVWKRNKNIIQRTAEGRSYDQSVQCNCISTETNYYLSCCVVGTAFVSN